MVVWFSQMVVVPRMVGTVTLYSLIVVERTDWQPNAFVTVTV